METVYADFGRRVWLWLVDNHDPQIPVMDRLVDIAVQAGLLVEVQAETATKDQDSAG